jgi:hypothetical protein
VALQGGVVPLCLAWPTASPDPAAPGALPPVHTLVLDGQMDVRTPVEDAQQVPARIPGAELVTIPYTGHSVLGSDESGCAKKALATFFASQPEAPCPPSDNPYAPTPRPPARLDAITAIGPKGKPGRTLAAALGSITDARRQVIGEAMALGQVPQRIGGLRGGTVTASTSGYRLRAYEYVPGVAVTGTLASDRSGTFSVSGPAAARGTLKLSVDARTVTGRLGGRSVKFTAASAAAAGTGDRLPALAQVLKAPRLR